MYKIWVEDRRTGKKYFVHCGDECPALKSGYFEEGEFIFVPEFFDEFVGKYDPFHLNGWMGLLEYSLRDAHEERPNIFDSPFHSLQEWDGLPVYFVLVRLVGYSMSIYDDIIAIEPGIAQRFKGILKVDRCPDKSEILARFIGTRSLISGKILTPGHINFDNMKDNLFEISVLYTGLASVATSGTDSNWGLKTFGAFVHILCSSIQHAVDNVVKGDDESNEAYENLVIRVEECKGTPPAGKAIEQDWHILSSAAARGNLRELMKRLPLDEIQKFIEEEVEGFDVDEDDEEGDLLKGSDDEFWSQF